MKRILVPVDFSEDSVSAIDIGVEIANHLQANLRLIHIRTGQRVYPEFAKSHPELLLADMDTTYMDFLLKRAVKNFKAPHREVDYKIREGNIVREITNQAHYDDTTLIVIGTHGVSGFEDRWIGSNAYRLAAHATCPILTVNKNTVFSGERVIMLPIDHSRKSRRIATNVVKFAKIIDAKILLVGINENNRWFIPGRLALFVKQVEKFMKKDEKVKFETVILERSMGTPKQVIDYAKESKVTCIALPVQKSINPFESFFNPYANELLNISDLPILVIPEKQY